MSSVGVVATTVAGTPFFRDGFFFGSLSSLGPAMRSTTPSFASFAAVALTSEGTLVASVHGPASAGASRNPSNRWR